MGGPPRGYIGAIGIAGFVAAISTMVALPTAGERWASFVVLASLASVAALVPIRWVRDEGTQGFTLEGGVFVAFLLTGPVALAPLVLATASLVAHGVRSREPAKWTFNAGRVGLETTAGALTFWAVAPAAPSPTDPRSLGAVLVAAVVYEVVSIATMTELFHRMSGTGRRVALHDVTELSLATFSINTAYGLVLGTVAMVSPWITGLSGLLMVGLYVGFRGHAAAVTDSRRAQSLHALTSQLLDVSLSRDPLTEVVPRLAAVFGAARAEVVLELGRDWWRWALRDAQVIVTREPSLPRTGEIGAAVAHDHGALDTAVTSDGRREQRLSAPVRRHGELVGAIVVGGRRGLEPWDDADAVMLSAIANELAVVLDNVALFGQVEEERARLEAESTKLTDILTAATDGIIAVGEQGTIEAWNPGMARITGVEPDVAVGQPWHSVLRLRDADGTELAPTGDHLAARIMSGEQAGVAVSLQGLRADGVWRWLQCTSSPVRHHDGRAGAVIVARDVTAERELEELKADFIATVSHELRTPLTPLKGFLSTLRTPRTPLSEEQVGTIHAAMGSQLVRLETLISDLLAVAELDHGQFALHPEPVELAPVLADAVEVEAADDADRCRVELPPDVVAVADPVALVRIVRSLVSNALKHTAGSVHVSAEHVDDHVEVRIRDEGPGIAAWDQQRVFNRFERLGDHLTRTQGPGLGLTIARTLARRMDGDVVVESEIGVGATFLLRLPCPRPRPVPLRAVREA